MWPKLVSGEGAPAAYSGLRKAISSSGGAGDLTMLHPLEDQLFPWVFGGGVIMMIIADIALILVVFAQ